MGINGINVALTGVGLLVGDIVLLVPSSLIMIANGALFGVAIGTILSIMGNLGAALVGFFIGRRGEPVLARFIPPEESSRANHFLNEWGLLAIIITRPVPLLLETTIIMAGASTMHWRSMGTAYEFLRESRRSVLERSGSCGDGHPEWLLERIVWTSLMSKR
jgi:uncharacterized membrane protein YdjX (TVP38/TMEM64 family)